METWIILGASSAMARAFARDLARDGHHLVLCGRDRDDMERNAKDAGLRGAASVKVLSFDTRDPDSWAGIVEAAEKAPAPISVGVFAGSMPPQEAVEEDPGLMAGLVADNYGGLAAILLHLAPILEAQGTGQVVGVSSVAGDRGRISNYAYGSAKAGFTTFLAGLRNRLGRKGVHVMTVKPGFVDTAMTWGLEGLFLVASPADISAAIRKGLAKKRNTIYAPWFWWGIMTIIKHIPEFIFKKMSI